jgi:hypothetical protein
MTVSVNVLNILAGPMDVFEAPVGTAEPTQADNLDNVVLNAAWRDCGGSNGGLKFVIAQSFGKVTADQTVDIIASLANERSVTAELSLLESTLANIKMSNNGGTIVTGANTSKYEPITNTVSTPPDYRALLFRGVSAVNGKQGVVVLRRTLVTSDVAMTFKKDDATMLGVTYTSHYVSSSIPPFVILLEN